MGPNISEFSFGFALTSELLSYYKLMTTGAPVFPSLTAEGALGYDVKLPLHGSPVFLQFKLSHRMIRVNAIGSKLMPPPHYRMPLRPLKYSQQHNLLLKLEARGHDVFYATPEFHEPEELNDAYSSNRVVRRSAFFRPMAIGVLPDPDEHFVLFATASRKAYRLSEPVEISRQEGHSFFLERLANTKNQEALGQERLRALGDELVTVWEEEAAISPESVSSIRRAREGRGPGEFLSYVSRTLFDSEVLFVVRERSRSSAE